MRDRGAVDILGFAFFNPFRLMNEVLLCCYSSLAGRTINTKNCRQTNNVSPHNIALIRQKSKNNRVNVRRWVFLVPSCHAGRKKFLYSMRIKRARVFAD